MSNTLTALNNDNLAFFLSAVAGFEAVTFDSRFSPPLPLTGTWGGAPFTFTWNANGTINTSTVCFANKVAAYRADGALLSYK